MMQDREQKQRALAYVVSKGWFPQLELDVSTYVTTREKGLSITDVDVFASIPDDFLGNRRFLIDCKTKRNESPIGRALWQKGVMERVCADRGMCVLKKDAIEQDHRYTAAQLGVILLTEAEFETYAKATSANYGKISGHVVDVALWERFFELGRKFPSLSRAIDFSRSKFWMSESDSEACRRTLGMLKHIRPELDPAKPEHLAIVGDSTSLFLHSLAGLVSRVFFGYLQPSRQEDLSTALLVLMFGGRDSYEQRNRLMKAVLATKNVGGADDLALPEWERFVEFIRQTLDAPLEVARSPLIAREVAWSFLAEKRDRSYGIALSKASPQGARFAVLALDYLCRATQLPPEFCKVLGGELLEVQSA